VSKLTYPPNLQEPIDPKCWQKSFSWLCSRLWTILDSDLDFLIDDTAEFERTPTGQINKKYANEYKILIENKPVSRVVLPRYQNHFFKKTQLIKEKMDELGWCKL